MLFLDPAEHELLSSAHDRARRLLDTLRRQETELSADTSLGSSVREAGLQVIRRAVDCANQLVAKTERALLQTDPRARSTNAYIDQGGAQ